MKNLLLTKTIFRTTFAEVFHRNDVKLRVRMAICRCEIAVVLSRLYFLYDLSLPAFYDVTEMENGERENENDNKTERTGILKLHLDQRHGITAKIARKPANVNSR